MGLIRIRPEDVRRAYVNDAFDRVLKLLEGADTAEEISHRCHRDALRLGLIVRHKSSSSLKWSKFTTTFYEEVRLGSDFYEEPAWAQAATWAHELVHVHQWRIVGRAKFGRRYVFSLRWRWMYEMQAYRMSILIRQRLGVSEEMTLRYIRQKPESLRSSYLLMGLRNNHLRDYTRQILTSEMDKDPFRYAV